MAGAGNGSSRNRNAAALHPKWRARVGKWRSAGGKGWVQESKGWVQESKWWVQESKWWVRALKWVDRTRNLWRRLLDGERSNPERENPTCEKRVHAENPFVRLKNRFVQALDRVVHGQKWLVHGPGASCPLSRVGQWRSSPVLLLSRGPKTRSADAKGWAAGAKGVSPPACLDGGRFIHGGGFSTETAGQSL